MSAGYFRAAVLPELAAVRRQGGAGPAARSSRPASAAGRTDQGPHRRRGISSSPSIPRCGRRSSSSDSRNKAAHQGRGELLAASGLDENSPPRPCARPHGVFQACASMGSLGNPGAIIQPPRFEQRPRSTCRGSTSRASKRRRRPTVDASHQSESVRAAARHLQERHASILEDSRAADADFPLGLPLAAGGDSVIPIDISISFSDLPRLGVSAQRLLARQAVPYRPRRHGRRRRRTSRAAGVRPDDAHPRRDGGPLRD